MKQIVNEAVLELLNNGLITIERINSLIYIKEFIDRISVRNYISDSEVKELVMKYGVKPNIITWGDYFQTEMASSLLPLSEDEFIQAVETVKYDMISSSIIFSDKDSSFFEWIDGIEIECDGDDYESLSEDDQELLHLKILKDYYIDLGITDNFTESEIGWYWSFKRAVAI